MLQVGVGRVGEAFFLLSPRIELNQVARDVFDALFRAFLHALPCARAEQTQSGWLARVAAAIFADFVERVNRHIHLVVVLENHADDLVFVDFHQAAELPDAVIDVDEVVADFHFLQLFHRERHFPLSGALALERELVEAVENLVVCEETGLQVVVDETLVQCFIDSREVVLLDS